MQSPLLLLSAIAIPFLGLVGAQPFSPSDVGAASPRSTSPVAAESAGPRHGKLDRESTDPVIPVTPVSRAEAALDILTRSVREQSHPDALRMAFQAYYNYRTANPRQVRKPYLFFVDYGLDSHTPRGYIFDMDALRLVDGPFAVAHGRGSAPSPEGVPTRFSNREGSLATSLGLFLAQETYPFSGKSGGVAYRSVGLRLRGLSGSFNDAARARGVVVHGAPYVTAARAGRSEGCPAMEPDRARVMIPKISDGGLVFLFSPLDREWLRRDPWVNGAARQG